MYPPHSKSKGASQLNGEASHSRAFRCSREYILPECSRESSLLYFYRRDWREIGKEKGEFVSMRRLAKVFECSRVGGRLGGARLQIERRAALYGQYRAAMNCWRDVIAR